MTSPPLSTETDTAQPPSLSHSSVTPVARGTGPLVVSNSTAVTRHSVLMVRLGRARTSASRYAAEALDRVPSGATVMCIGPIPSCMYPFGSSVTGYPACAPAATMAAFSGAVMGVLPCRTCSGPSIPTYRASIPGSISPALKHSARRKYGRHAL